MQVSGDEPPRGRRRCWPPACGCRFGSSRPGGARSDARQESIRPSALGGDPAGSRHLAGPPRGSTVARSLLASDDWTFRPTVVVRRGPSQGSGTIIASVEGETLVLTAVARDPRVGADLRRAPPLQPRAGAHARAAGRLAAADRRRGRRDRSPPPTWRSSASRASPPCPMSPAWRRRVASRRSTRPSPRSASTWAPGSRAGPRRLVEALWFELNDNRDERLFFITARAPEHGRSGGGLFLPDGELVGVCVGHTELFRGRRQGVFASRESIRQLLIDHDLTSVIARSELRRSRLVRRPSRRPAAGDGDAEATSPSPVTPTGAVDAGR